MVDPLLCFSPRAAGPKEKSTKKRTIANDGAKMPQDIVLSPVVSGDGLYIFWKGNHSIYTVRDHN